jgi:hypothetical protein
MAEFEIQETIDNIDGEQQRKPQLPKPKLPTPSNAMKPALPKPALPKPTNVSQVTQEPISTPSQLREEQQFSQELRNRQLLEKQVFGNKATDIATTVPAIKPIESKQEVQQRVSEMTDIKKRNLDDALKKTAKYRIEKQAKEKGYLDKQVSKDEQQFKEQELKQEYDKGNLVLQKDPSGGYFLSRPQGFFESVKNSLNESIEAPFSAIDINKAAAQGNDKKLVELIEERKSKQEQYPESVDAGKASSFFGNLLGSAPKPLAMMGASEITTGSPVAGAVAMGAEQAWTNYQNNLTRLYEEELARNPNATKEEAMAKARGAANKDIVADVASGVTMGMMGGEQQGLFKSVVNRLPNQTAKEVFVNAAKNTLKHAYKFGRIGASTEMLKNVLEDKSGYDRSFNDVMKSGIEGFKDMALMDMAFKVISLKTYTDLANAPKFMKSAAKEYLATLPDHLVDRTLFELGEKGEAIKQSLDKYRQIRSQFEGVVPENQVGTFAGWQEKINSLKEKNTELQSKINPNITEVANEPLKKQIAINKAEIAKAEDTLKEYLEKGKIVEKDNLTGDVLNEPIKEENETTEPISTTPRPETQGKEEIQEPIEPTNESITGVAEPITTETESIAEAKPIEVVQPTEEVKVGSKGDADIEKRMLKIQDSNPSFDSKEQAEFNSLEKEMEKRERSSVFDVPLEKVNDAVDALMKKEKEMPNGFGSFIEKRDARETKEISTKYSSPKEISDAELKSDFKESLMGNPKTWYADGLKLRESMKEAANRGIDINDMLKEVEAEFTKEGYDANTAKEMVAYYLKPIFEGSTKVETDKSKLVEQSKPTEVKAEQPNVSETEKVTTKPIVSDEPPLPKGETIVTPNGLTESERQVLIEKRKKSTAITEQEKTENGLVALMKKRNEKNALPTDKRNIDSKINQLVRKLNAEAEYEKYRYSNGVIGKRTKVRTGSIKGSTRYKTLSEVNRDANNGSIKEDAVVFTERPKNVRDTYDALLDKDTIQYLHIMDASGKKAMSKEQIKSAIDDIENGIPSVGADSLLNTIEQATKDGNLPVIESGFKTSIPLEDVLNVKKEVVGEPFSEENLMNWLNEESQNLTPEHQEILDNELNNIIYEYEQGGIEIEIPKSNTTAETTSSKIVEPKVSDATVNEKASQEVTNVFTESDNPSREGKSKKALIDARKEVFEKYKEKYGEDVKEKVKDINSNFEKYTKALKEVGEIIKIEC